MNRIPESQYQKYLELDSYPQPHMIIKDILIKKLIAKSGLPKSSHFLDFGCGRGRILKIMADRGFQNGLGIDMQDICIDICQKRLKGTGIEVKNIALNEIDEAFDLIIMSSILEHIEDDQAFLHMVNLHINKGRYFLFTVPGDMRLYGKRDIAYGHYRRYEKEELINKLEKAGFQIDALWSYGINFISRMYRTIIKKDIKSKYNQTVTIASTEESAIIQQGLESKRMYPIYIRLMFLYKLQLLLLNSNLFRANYAGLFRKI